MFRNILTGAAALALITGASAQQKQQMTVNKTTATPQFAGTFHPSTGLVNSNGGVAKLGPDSIFNNNILSNYYSVPGMDQEWIDEGILADRNSGSTDQINGMNFTYCSNEAVAIQNTITVYDEVTICGGPLAWPTADCAYAVGGLPGQNNGAFACWIVTVDLTGIECNVTTDPAQNRYFGWGQAWDNASTGPWIASGGNGADNSFTWFDTNAPNANAAFLGCYWFGGTPFANFAAQLFGNPVETFSYSSATNGRRADDNIVMTLDASAQAGATVTFSTGVATTLFAASTAVDVDLLPIFGIEASLLADYQRRQFTSTGLTDHAVTVPAGISGMFYTQAGAVDINGNPTAMSNGLSHNIF